MVSIFVRGFVVVLLLTESINLSGCSLWPATRDAVVDCAVESSKAVWASEASHLREMIETGVSYDSVVSYTTGLALRFGKPFVICLWRQIKNRPAALTEGQAQLRGSLYADRWLAENQ